MRIFYKFLGVSLLALFLTASAFAQRPRATTDTTETASTNAPKPAPAPQSFKAKYEGGVFGYNQKMDGTLNFDDVNSRLVFRDEQQKEILSLPYSALSGAYADTKSRMPTSAKVLSNVPTVGLPARLIKKKYRYLTLQFNDKDTNAAGITSFEIEDKELLASVLSTLADKAGLEPRGDGYVRKKDTTTP
jgi:hypothetical protein